MLSTLRAQKLGSSLEFSVGAGPGRLFHNSRRFATRVVQHASLVQDATLLNCTISIQHLPVVVQCTSHSRELGKRRSWSSAVTRRSLSRQGRVRVHTISFLKIIDATPKHQNTPSIAHHPLLSSHTQWPPPPQPPSAAPSPRVECTPSPRSSFR